MAEKLIGSLIYGEHQIPKKSRPWKQRIKVPLIVAVAVLLVGGAVYKFINYREERRVTVFLADVLAAQYDAAYANWELTGSSYTMKDFLSDWGKDGYYTKGMSSGKVIDSNSKGSSVIVYLRIDPEKRPVALLVNKESLKISFSPNNKYR